MSKKQWTGKVLQVVLIFLAGFAIGCLYMNVLWKNGGYILQNEKLLSLYEVFQENITSEELFRRMLIWGCALFFFLFLSGFARLGKALAQGVCLCAGTMYGSFLTLYLLGKGVKSSLLILLGGLPQGLVLVPVLVVGVIFVCNMSTKTILLEKDSKVLYRKYSFSMIVLFVLLVFGIFLKCYVNPIFLSFLQKF